MLGIPKLRQVTDINKQNKDGWTALMLADKFKNGSNTINILLDNDPTIIYNKDFN